MLKGKILIHLDTANVSKLAESTTNQPHTNLENFTNVMSFVRGEKKNT